MLGHDKTGNCIEDGFESFPDCYLLLHPGTRGFIGNLEKKCNSVLLTTVTGIPIVNIKLPKEVGAVGFGFGCLDGGGNSALKNSPSLLHNLHPSSESRWGFTTMGTVGLFVTLGSRME